MWNPFGPKGGQIRLNQYDVMNLLGAKEADLMIARGQLQQAAQTIEQLRAENEALKKAAQAKTDEPAKTVPELVK